MMAPPRDRGAADALALVLIAPACIGLALLVVSMGRGVDSVAQVRSAAESAAQAAALERTASRAASAAERIAAQMLVDADTCGDPNVDVDVSRFGADGSVAVTIVCNPSPVGVEAIRPSVGEVSARALARVDPFRSDDG
jgi:Flp pilus assembly protein TadG